MSRGSYTLKNPINTISFRQATKIENPDGIPLAKKFNDYGFAWDGQLLLSYEPPVVIKNVISVAITGRINGTKDEFSGIVESQFSGDVFSPSQDLISSIQKMVRVMAQEMEETNQTTIAEVIEEIVGYCVINVPVKQVYERIRVDYPTEFRSLNIAYRRQNGKTILEDIETIKSEQKNYTASVVKSFIKKAFKKQDLVHLDVSKIEKRDPDLYKKIKKDLNIVTDINGKYIVYEDTGGEGTLLVGRDKNNPNKLMRLDDPIPNDYLQEFKDDVAEYFEDDQEEQGQEIKGLDKSVIDQAKDAINTLNKITDPKQRHKMFESLHKKIRYAIPFLMKKDEKEKYKNQKQQEGIAETSEDIVFQKLKNGENLDDNEVVVAFNQVLPTLKKNQIDLIFEKSVSKPQLENYYNRIKDQKNLPKPVAVLVNYLNKKLNPTPRAPRQGLETIVQEYGIDPSVFNDHDRAMENKDKILSLIKHYNDDGKKIPPALQNLANSLQ